MTPRTRMVWRVVSGVSAAALIAFTVWMIVPLPPALAAPGPVPTLVLLDRHGLPLRATRAAAGARGGWTGLADLDPKLLQAFLAVEDRRFYDHAGVDLRALARALVQDLRAGAVVSGGSTIAMQLARLLRGTPRTLSGKLRQIAWALRLDAHLDKQSILEQYLNRVPLGQGTAGVTAAAGLYFGADPTNLSLGQAALLAALAHAPSRDNPLVDPGRARARRALALDRMAALGYARPEDVARANAEPVLTHDPTTPFLAPHFTTRVLQWADAGGAPPSGEWQTTLDLGLQTALEAEVRHTVEVLAERGVAHAAIVVVDNAGGDVLAWVGSPDFFADTAGQVDMVVSPRQPGSALKPFLYGLAFDRGFTPASVLPDLPRTFQTTLGPYRPRNYDREFHGPVRARDALGSSYNVPAVDLAERIGAASLLATLHDAGFTTLHHSAEYYGLGLSLGNGDVTLLELANGYRALANGGVWRPVRWKTSAGDATDVTATAEHATERRVMSRPAATLVLDILSDPVARLPSFGAETPLDLPFKAAAKTGTSRHFTDNWAVATTAGFTVAVWVGNFSGRPMQGVGGITGAGPLLHRAALLVAQRYPPGTLTAPGQAGAVAVRVCRLSGLRAGPECPPMSEWFMPGTEPTRQCDWHRAGGGVVLPVEYAEWKGSEPAVTGWVDPGAAPRGSQDTDAFRILSPQDGDRYSLPVGADARYATIALRAAGGDGSSVRWFVNGREWRAARWRLAPGRHVIRAVTARGASDEVRIEVR